MRYLRYLFFLLLASSLFVVMMRGAWEGRLMQGNHAYIIALPTSPIWSAPDPPSYDAFRKAFSELPSDMEKSSEIHRVCRFDSALVELLLFGMSSATFCGLLYLFVRRGKRDPILHYVLFGGLGLLAGAAICFLLWLLLGGWAAPAPVAFGVLGMIGGIYFGRRQWVKAR